MSIYQPCCRAQAAFKIIYGIGENIITRPIAFRCGLWYMCWLEKGAITMYDYMRALRNKFYTPPESEKLRRELDAVHADLHERLNRDEQKLLLRITDLQCSLQDEASLHSFFAGYKLASGIHRELAQEPPYSFDKDEEKTAEALYQAEKKAATPGKEE